MTPRPKVPTSLISTVLVLIVVGILLWLINLIPMDPAIYTIIRVVVIVAVIIWLLRAFGLVRGKHLKL